MSRGRSPVEARPARGSQPAPGPRIVAGETVVIACRPHGRALVVPVGALLAVAFGGSYAFFSMPAGAIRLAVLVLASALVLWLAGGPFLRWRGTSYVVTDRRAAIRSGVLSRTGRDVPLHRVTDVSLSRGVLARLLGSGTLTLETPGEQRPLVLADVPRAVEVHRTLLRVLADAVPEPPPAEPVPDSGWPAQTGGRLRRRGWRRRGSRSVGFR